MSLTLNSDPNASTFKEFTDYLLDTGLLCGSNLAEFKKIYQGVSESHCNLSTIKPLDSHTDPTNTSSLSMIYFKDNISKTFVEFLNQMSDENKKLMGMNLVMKFLSQKRGGNSAAVGNKGVSIELSKVSEACKLLRNYYLRNHVRPYFKRWGESVVNKRNKSDGKNLGQDCYKSFDSNNKDFGVKLINNKVADTNYSTDFYSNNNGTLNDKADNSKNSKYYFNTTNNNMKNIANLTYHINTSNPTDLNSNIKPISHSNHQSYSELLGLTNNILNNKQLSNTVSYEPIMHSPNNKNTLKISNDHNRNTYFSQSPNVTKLEVESILGKETSELYQKYLLSKNKEDYGDYSGQKNEVHSPVKSMNMLNYESYLDSSSKDKNFSITNKRAKSSRAIKNIKKYNTANMAYITNLYKRRPNHALIFENTTEYRKEQNNLKECTFKPRINNPGLEEEKLTRNVRNKEENEGLEGMRSGEKGYNSQKSLKCLPKSQISNVIHRLTTDTKNRLARKEMNEIAKNKFEADENPFQPNLTQTRTFRGGEGAKLGGGFKERMLNDKKKRQEKLDKIAKEMEDNFNAKHTFQPEINNKDFSSMFLNKYDVLNESAKEKNSAINHSFSEKNHIPIYVKLYNDNKKNNNKLEEKRKEIYDSIVRSSNNPLNNAGNNGGGKVDYKKIESLYNDYKKYKENLKEKEEEINKDRGYTFQPENYSKHKYFSKINTTFEERQNNFIKNKEEHINKYIDYLDQQRETHDLFFNNNYGKVYSNKEKMEIENDVINRLYKKGVEKYISRKGGLASDSKAKKDEKNEEEKIETDKGKEKNVNDSGEKVDGDNEGKEGNEEE